MVARPFRSRKPKSSPLWKCFHAHFDHFSAVYPRDYQSSRPCRIAHQCVRDFLRDAFGDAFGNADGVGKCEQDGVTAIVMAIHTFGEYLDFHPHLHALVADGLFDREGKFHVMRAGELAGEFAQEQRGTTDAHHAGNHAALEQLFRARVIAFLVEVGLLPLDRARMLRGWVHSGFQVHQSRRIAANECQRRTSVKI